MTEKYYDILKIGYDLLKSDEITTIKVFQHPQDPNFIKFFEEIEAHEVLFTKWILLNFREIEEDECHSRLFFDIIPKNAISIENYLKQYPSTKADEIIKLYFKAMDIVNDFNNMYGDVNSSKKITDLEDEFSRIVK